MTLYWRIYKRFGAIQILDLSKLIDLNNSESKNPTLCGILFTKNYVIQKGLCMPFPPP